MLCSPILTVQLRLNFNLFCGHVKSGEKKERYEALHLLSRYVYFKLLMPNPSGGQISFDPIEYSKLNVVQYFDRDQKSNNSYIEHSQKK